MDQTNGHQATFKAVEESEATPIRAAKGKLIVGELGELNRAGISPKMGEALCFNRDFEAQDF